MRTPSHVISQDGTRLAYYAIPAKKGKQRPGIVFLGGFMSSMMGNKATALEAWAKKNGYAFLRYDYYGHGSSGGSIENATISRWVEDSKTIINFVCGRIEGLDGPLILVGSSMGAWIMIHVALAIKENETRQRVVGLMGIAAAPDFTQDLLPNYLGTKAMTKIYKEGVYQMSSDYSDEPYIITKELIQDGNRMSVLKSGININLPVRLIHGTSDKEVPWDQSRKLMQALISEDVELILVKGGNHRLSNKDELQRIFITLDSLINSLELEDSIFEN